jgi:CPA2 family monovalent cation:H+ antiporter-2
MDLPELIQDLGLLLMAAAVMTLLFKWLRQPIVLGYLIAGFLVGPHFKVLPTVHDTHSIETWSQIGVIFMLFGLGLEFSFRKLTHVGKTATITAAFEILCMIIIGYVAGRILGWDTMSSLFLGAILSMSSTTIIIKAFDEQNLKGVNFASIVFGVLIVEDLIAILLLVLLSSIAVTQQLSGIELIKSSCQLLFFLILWFILGIYLLPVFFKHCRKLFTDEILLIVSIALCFMMVIIAVKLGFSSALGAFVMGSLLAETVKGSKIEELIVPVKDLFSAVFFVSVGMLIDPQILVKYFGIIILMMAITIIGKFFGTAIGALISGCNIKNSMQSGMSMAQIGEFSFIIAMLGTTLKVTNEILYPIAVAVSAITTFTTPYLIKYSGTLADSLERKIPERLRFSLLKYEAVMRDTGKRGIIGLIWQAHGIKILLNSVMIVGITIGCRYAAPYINENFIQGQVHIWNYLMCLVTVILSTPFLWAIFLSRRPRSGDYDTETIAMLQRLHFGVSIVRLFIGFILVGFIVGNFVSVYAFSGFVLIPFVVLALVLFSNYFEPIYHKFETQFITHLTEKEKEEIASKAKLSNLAPWDVTLTEFVLSQNSSLVAKTLRESRLRNRFGVIVAMIERGNLRLIPPGGDDLLLPFDKIFLLGTDAQLALARDEIEKDQTSDIEMVNDDEIGLMSVLLESEHPFVGLMVLECGIRELAGGLIVGIEHNGTRQLNPMPEMVLQANDLLWIVGNKDSIKHLQNKNFEFVSSSNIYQNTMVDYSGY